MKGLFSGDQCASYTLGRDEKGYVLLTMLLVVSLMAITAAVALPTISFEIRRDREQEMIHRGVQYSRAIRAYYKKFGRYPTRLEDLDNTSNQRFLRKHYKDPITGKDFKLLHYGEQGVNLAGGIAGGSIPGANAIGSTGGLNAASGFGQPSAFGGNANSPFGANSNSTSALNSSAANPTPSADPSQNSSSSNSPDSSSAKTVTGSGSSSDQSSSNQVVASGPIVGVASISKKRTIREFNKKKKYDEWQFVYDPATDRGGLITTPYQPSLQSFGGAGQGLLPGQGTQPGNSTGSPFGQSSGFGNQPSPFGNGPNSNLPAQPPSNPPQQQ
jgi:type II secretory pathway pseudopilin PulG